MQALLVALLFHTLPTPAPTCCLPQTNENPKPYTQRQLKVLRKPWLPHFVALAYLCFMRLVALLGVSALLAQTGGVRFFSGTWEALLEEAKRQNKPIFVDFYATWCGPCKMLERYTFSNPEVGSFAEKHFLAYRIDAEKGEGPRLANQFRVRAYPTIVFLTPQGSELGRQVGYVDAPAFLSLLKRYYERFGDKQGEARPSWEGFQEQYRVFLADLTSQAWEKNFPEVWASWRKALEASDYTAAQAALEPLTSPAKEVLTALTQAAQGQSNAALHALHHKLYQNQKLSPSQTLWLGAYTLLYWPTPPPEAIQWVSFTARKDPSGVAYLTLAALYYRLGRLEDARSALKEARKDLPPDQPAYQILSSLLSPK